MEPIDIKKLIRRRPRKQTGQYRESDSAFFIRFYRVGRRVEIKVADKSAQFRTRADVEHLITKLLSGDAAPESNTLAGFVETKYLPWVSANRAPATVHGYKKLWEKIWKPAVGHKVMATLTTPDVSAVLTHLAQNGHGSSAISHAKWTLSGIFVYAINTGVLNQNPVPDAKALVEIPRSTKKQAYGLPEMLRMLRALEAVDLQAAVALALAYFGSLRPSEISGLKWEDWTGEVLQIRRSVWHGQEGRLKTEASERDVIVLQPLQRLLEKLRTLTGGKGFVLENEHHRPLDLNNLNRRVIAPTLKAANLPWCGYYGARRGFLTLMTNTSGNILNAAGHAGHSDIGTTARHYTKPQVDKIRESLQAIEDLVREAAKGGTETLQ